MPPSSIICKCKQKSSSRKANKCAAALNMFSHPVRVGQSSLQASLHGGHEASPKSPDALPDITGEAELLGRQR